jgi:hypothetical protein
MLSAAFEMDRNLGLVSQAPKVNSDKMQMNTQMLSVLYGELTKNLEMTRFSLSQQEPIFEIIDPTLRPLIKIGKGRTKAGLIGGFIAEFIILLILFLRSLFS